MLKDYARCVYYESKGNPARALRVAGELLRSRIKHGIGPFYYSLFRLAHTPTSQWSNYFLDTEFFARILGKVNSRDMRDLLKDKALFYQYCLDHDVPTPPVIGVVARPTHPLLSGSNTRIDDLEQWKTAMESAPPELFVKPIDGSYGSGTFIIRRLGQNFSFGQAGQQGSVEDLYHYVLDCLKKETALLVQPRIRSHPKVLEISSGSALATVRMVTAMVNNKAQLLYACVKLPVGTNITDNLSYGSSGNLAAAVDINTGILSEGWCAARSDWPLMQSTEVHPDTGQQIRGFTLPLWPEAVDLALAVQNGLPQLKTIGLDIAMTDDGVTLIEANGGYNIAILQVAHRRGLRSELLSVIGHEANSSPA